MITWKEFFKLSVFVEAIFIIVFACIWIFEYLVHGEHLSFTLFAQVSAIAMGGTILSVLIAPLAEWWFSK